MKLAQPRRITTTVAVVLIVAILLLVWLFTAGDDSSLVDMPSEPVDAIEGEVRYGKSTQAVVEALPLSQELHDPAEESRKDSNSEKAIRVLEKVHASLFETYYSKIVRRRELSPRRTVVTTTHEFHDSETSSLFRRVDTETIQETKKGIRRKFKTKLHNDEGDWFLVGDVAFLLTNDRLGRVPIADVTDSATFVPEEGVKYSYELVEVSGRRVHAIKMDSSQSPDMLEMMEALGLAYDPDDLRNQNLYIDAETGLRIGAGSDVELDGSFTGRQYELVQRAPTPPEGLFDVPESSTIVVVDDVAEAYRVLHSQFDLGPPVESP